MKRIKILVAVLAAVLVLSTVGSAVVLAQDGTTPTPSPQATAPGNPFLDRLAQKLGITVDKLKSAITEVRGDVRQEAFTKLVEKAVTNKVITADEAKLINDWWAGRPAVLDTLLAKADLGRIMANAGNLDKAVQNKVITQDEASKIKTWWDTRPDAVNKLVKGVKAGINKQMPRLRQFQGRMPRLPSGKGNGDDGAFGKPNRGKAAPQVKPSPTPATNRPNFIRVSA